MPSERELSSLEEQVLIQVFEFTHELAWKTLKDFHFRQGNTDIYGSRDACWEAFNIGIIENGGIWMDMIKSRKQRSHTYDQNTSEMIVKQVLEFYYEEFENLKLILSKKL